MQRLAIILLNQRHEPSCHPLLLLYPQIDYATVFFWEYFGPLVVYPLFYFFPQYLYPGMK